MIARRKFLKFLASSPLAATPAVTSMITALLASAPDPAFAQSYDVLRGARRSLGPDGVITAPGDALNVFEFEPAAKKAVLSQDAPDPRCQP
jgi:4-hydroxymandelate oxidase